MSARRKEFDRAIVEYNKALELNPKLALAYTDRAVAHENSGSVGAAIADYTRALEVDPNNHPSKSALEPLQGFYVNPNERVRAEAYWPSRLIASCAGLKLGSIASAALKSSLARFESPSAR